MSFVSMANNGLWLPLLPGYLLSTPPVASSDTALMDADEEEVQFIGTVVIDGGGSKTFGTSSKIGWSVGANPTFATGATVRLGVKQASRITTTAGPPARATIGAAAFDVWGELAGGTTTLTQLTWREDSMTTGTPLTVTDGDLLAVCFHLNVTSGTPIVRVSANAFVTPKTVNVTLVTSGPTYTTQFTSPAVLLLFNDGTFGWLEPSRVFSVADTVTPTIGSGNSIANILEVSFPCQIDALAAFLTTGSATGDCALELVSDPLGTPTVLETLAIDANLLTGTTAGLMIRRLPTPRTIAAQTPYAISIKQTTASVVISRYWDVPNANYFRVVGTGLTCYAANSTGGAAFVAQNSGLRRYLIYMRVSAVDDGAGDGALRTSSPMRRQALRFARSAV